jgi:hypothetical protein
MRRSLAPALEVQDIFTVDIDELRTAHMSTPPDVFG